jgi:hypothetical protein
MAFQFAQVSGFMRVVAKEEAGEGPAPHPFSLLSSLGFHDLTIQGEENEDRESLTKLGERGPSLSPS